MKSCLSVSVVLTVMGAFLALAEPNTCVWTGAARDGKWSTSGNWENGVKPVSGNDDWVSVSAATAGETMENDIDDLAIKKFYATGSGKYLTLTGKEISIWDAGVSWSNACRKVTVGTPITFLNAGRSDLVCYAEEGTVDHVLLPHVDLDAGLVLHVGEVAQELLESVCLAGLGLAGFGPSGT